MMTKERKDLLQAQITGVLEQEEFVQNLAKSSSAEDVSQLLASYKIEVTADEVIELTKDGNEALASFAESENDELREEDLTDVTGGSKFLRFLGAATLGAAGGAVMGFVCGVCPAATPVCYKIAIGYGIVAGAWVIKG